MNIKIVIGYHKPANIFKLNNDLFYNLQLGKAISKEANKDGNISSDSANWFKENTHGDDTGDNISTLNREFSELTGNYWMWKNYSALGNPDYVGFMQYRRILCLNKPSSVLKAYDRFQVKKFFNEIDVPYKCKNFERLLGYNDLENYVGPNKIIVCYKKNKEKLIDYNRKLTCFNQVSFEKALEIILDQKNIRKEDFLEYLNGYDYFWGNTFIIKKELFFELCNWLFPILFKINQSLDYSFLSIQEHRIIGYVAEILIGFFWLTKCKEKACELSPVKNIFIENCSLFPKNLSTKIDREANIIYILNNDYLKYLIPSLVSLLKHTSEENLYNIFILITSDVQQNVKENIKSLANQKVNINISFIDISYISSRSVFNNFKTTLFNTFLDLPKIFQFKDKIVYLDCDTIICSDIYNLAQVDISDYLIGACRDIDKRIAIKNNNFEPFSSYESDFKRINILNFVNPGVLLFNLKNIKKDEDFKGFVLFLTRFKGILNSNYNDLFNFIFSKKIYFLDQSWNICVHSLENLQNLAWDIDKDFSEKNKKDISEFRILHFNNSSKPLVDMSVYSNIWWNYNFKSPFYIQTLNELFSNNFSFRAREYCDSLKVITFFRYLISLYYLKFRIMSKITRRRKKHYLEKAKKTKKLLIFLKHK